MNENPNPIQILEEKLSAWEVTGMEFEAQVEYFKYLANDIIRLVIVNRDPIESITVHESVYDAVCSALQAIGLPEGYQDPTGATFEQSNADFKKYCAGLVVRNAPTGFFASVAPEILENAMPEQIFVQIITPGRREYAIVEAFDKQVGVTARLHSVGLVINPSYAERRLMCMLAALTMGVQQPEPEQLPPDAVMMATQAPKVIKR